MNRYSQSLVAYVLFGGILLPLALLAGALVAARAIAAEKSAREALHAEHLRLEAETRAMEARRDSMAVPLALRARVAQIGIRKDVPTLMAAIESAGLGREFLAMRSGFEAAPPIRGCRGISPDRVRLDLTGRWQTIGTAAHMMETALPLLFASEVELSPTSEGLGDVPPEGRAIAAALTYIALSPLPANEIKPATE